MSAKIWHEACCDPQHPWRYIIRVPMEHGYARVMGGRARTWAEAVDQLRAIWAEHSPPPGRREASGNGGRRPGATRAAP